MECSSCAKENPDDAIFCVSCAARLRCPNCNGLMVVGRVRLDFEAGWPQGGVLYCWLPDDKSQQSEPLSRKDWPNVSLRGSLCRHCRTVVLRY